MFTRILVDRGPGFDQIPDGYEGGLYLEVISRSFTVLVREKLPLNQLRLMGGTPRLTPTQVLEVHSGAPIMYSYDPQGLRPEPLTAGELMGTDGVFLTVDLSGGADGLVGYRAKKNSLLLDLSAIGVHDIPDFWEPLYADREPWLILEPEEFYLLMSFEGVSIPPGVAGEMTAYDPTSGELRTHYAGFFDPGFGFALEDGVIGSRAVMEVRAHDVPFALDHNQKIAHLEFEHMVSVPQKLYGRKIGSSYQNQHLRPSKHFKEPLISSDPKGPRNQKTTTGKTLRLFN